MTNGQTNAPTLVSVLERTRKLKDAGFFDEAATNLRKIGEHMARRIVLEAGLWDAACTDARGNTRGWPTFGNCLYQIRKHSLVDRNTLDNVFNPMQRFGNAGSHEIAVESHQINFVYEETRKYVPEFLKRFPDATVLGALPNPDKTKSSHTSSVHQHSGQSNQVKSNMSVAPSTHKANTAPKKQTAPRSSKQSPQDSSAQAGSPSQSPEETRRIALDATKSSDPFVRAKAQEILYMLAKNDRDAGKGNSGFVDPCPCGSGRCFRDCHQPTFETYTGYGHAYRYRSLSANGYFIEPFLTKAESKRGASPLDKIWVYYKEGRYERSVSPAELKEEMEVRIGSKISVGVPEDKLAVFDAIDNQKEATAWLEKNRPDYRDIVNNVKRQIDMALVSGVNTRDATGPMRSWMSSEIAGNA